MEEIEAIVNEEAKKAAADIEHLINQTIQVAILNALSAVLKPTADNASGDE